jgi:hypothetical protein
MPWDVNSLIFPIGNSTDRMKAKRTCQQRSTLPNPSPSASPKLKACRKPTSKASAPAEPNFSKRSRSTYEQNERLQDHQAGEVSDYNLAPSNKRARHFSEPAQHASEAPSFWFTIDDWIERTPCAKSVQERIESGEILPTTEKSLPKIGEADSQTVEDVDQKPQ